MVIAHALFKATLFLVVGVVDHSTGTRQLSELSGLRRRLPVTATIAGLAAASMAGIPPTLGFIAKEAGLEGVANLALTGDGTGIAPVPAWALLTVIVLGSAITVAYSLRFWWGAFGTKPGVPDAALTHTPEAGFVAAPALLGLASLVGGFLGQPLTTALTPVRRVARCRRAQPRAEAAAGGRPPAARVRDRASSVGAVLFWQRERIAADPADLPEGAGRRRLLPRHDAERRPAGRGGHCAHPARLAGPVRRHDPRRAHRRDLRHRSPASGPGRRSGSADNPGQVAVGAAHRGRSRAVADAPADGSAPCCCSGVTGYGTALLFLLHGAPDLALTQVLVETVSLLVFLLVLRKLPQVLHRASAQSGPLVADRDRRRRPGWRSPGRAADAGLADGHAGVRAVPGRRLLLRLRQQHRQRGAGGHPRLGHHRRDRRAEHRGHRGGEPDLPARPHRPAAARGRAAPTARHAWLAAGQPLDCRPPSARSSSRSSPGCCSR